ncbi:MAG: hypothetical protein ACRDJP_05735, partial [Actinomycetota bacterium]
MRRPASEEGYELTIGAEDAAAAGVAPEAAPSSPGEWVRRNLFPNVRNGILTVVVAAVAVWLAITAISFVFGDADWSVLKANLRVYAVGRFPLDEVWRVWVCIYAFA